MYINKRAFLALLFCLFSTNLMIATRLVTIDIPEWHNEANDLLASLSNIENGMADNMELLKNWQTVLYDSITSLAEHELSRNEYSIEVANRLDSLRNELVVIKNSIVEKDSMITSLQDQLASLLEQLSSKDANLIELQDDIVQLRGEIEETRLAYDELMQLNGEKAQELILVINRMKSAHQQISTERDLFIAVLNQYVNAVKNYLLDEDTLFAREALSVTDNVDNQ